MATPLINLLGCFLLFLSVFTDAVRARHQASSEASEGIAGRRTLLSFREKQSGSNLMFDCSPSGPCIRCEYSEKKDAKYRCAETGYRIPLKCVPAKKDATKPKKENRNNRSALEVTQIERILQSDLDDSLYGQRHLLVETSKESSMDYTSYRSCVPPVDEEKLSVLGFEVFVLTLLLISSAVIYVRRKNSPAVSGPGRIQMSSTVRDVLQNNVYSAVAVGGSVREEQPVDGLSLASKRGA